MAGEKRENLEFVQFIERYPCLYDHTCKSYSYETDKTWQAVADEFQMTVKRCKEKWKNIRTVFRRHHFAKPVSEADGAPIKEYYLSDALQYLVPTLRGNPKPYSSSLPIITQIKEEQDKNSEQMGENDNILSSVPDEEDNDTTELPEVPKFTLNSSVGSTTSSALEFRKNRLGKRKANSSLDNDMINYCKSKVKPGDNRTNTDVEDPEAQADEHFLLSLKEDMKEMNARQKRTFKKKIFDLIDDVLDNE